jgi:alkaline phosphatase
MSCPSMTLWADSPVRPVRFGMITDFHYADRPQLGSRFYSQSKQKLEEAIRIFNQSHLDFIVELGDLKDQDDPPSSSRTLGYVDEIEAVMQQFHGPVYHVLGNHDMDSISKQDFLSYTRNHGAAAGKNHYSFMMNGLKFIVLDANYNADGTDYASGNFDWTYAQIPDSQLKWLQAELAEGDGPVIIFVHQLLDWFSGAPEALTIKNAQAAVEILEKSRRVLAVFQGHFHEGNRSERNGIHFHTLNAAVEGSLPENNSFAIVEIDKALHIHLSCYYDNQLIEYNMPYVEQ